MSNSASHHGRPHGHYRRKRDPDDAHRQTCSSERRALQIVRSRRGLPPLVLAGVTLLVTACGGSPGSHVAQLGSTDRLLGHAERHRRPSRRRQIRRLLAYSRCMRSHGVPNFPDPNKLVAESRSPAPRRESTRSRPCSRPRRSPVGTCSQAAASRTNAEQQRVLTRMLHSSQCMRAHRDPGFPDPTLSPPSSRAGHSTITSNGVAWLAIPKSIDVRSPAFKQAAAACSLGLALTDSTSGPPCPHLTTALRLPLALRRIARPASRAHPLGPPTLGQTARSDGSRVTESFAATRHPSHLSTLTQRR